MKQHFIKISSLTLAFFVLLSTFSFTVDKHFCGDFLVDVSFVGEADGCGMEKDLSAKKMKNCCSDEQISFEGQDELQQSKIQDINFEKQQFLVAFVVSYQDIFVDTQDNQDYFVDFSPPDKPKDFQVLYQTFLI